VMEFSHDIAGNEEIVTDKLGRISLYVYDDEGNVHIKPLTKYINLWYNNE